MQKFNQNKQTKLDKNFKKTQIFYNFLSISEIHKNPTKFMASIRINGHRGRHLGLVIVLLSFFYVFFAVNKIDQVEGN
jgi:hypothetical protein